MFVSSFFSTCKKVHYYEQYNCPKLHNTVEPPNKGHFGNGFFVLSSEVVPISEVHCILIFLSSLQCLNCCG